MSRQSTAPPTDLGAEALFDVLRSRREIIAAIEAEPRSKAALVEATDVSRSTVDRAIGTLAAAGIVADGDDGAYELTLFGTMLVREYERALDRLGSVSTLKPAIDDAGRDGRVTPVLVEDATVTYADGVGVSALLDAFAGATEVHLVDPPVAFAVLGLTGPDGPGLDGALTVVVRREVLAEIAAYSPTVLDAYRAHDIAVYETDARLPFSFALVADDDRWSVCVVLGDEHATAVIESTAPAALEWADVLYDDTAGNARPVTEPSASTG